MPPRITVDTLDSLRPNLRTLITERARALPDLHYCDLRIEVREGKGAVAENGFAKAASEDYSFDFGVRAISGDRATAAGYYGRVLGQSDAANIEAVVRARPGGSPPTRPRQCRPQGTGSPSPHPARRLARRLGPRPSAARGGQP